MFKTGDKIRIRPERVSDWVREDIGHLIGTVTAVDDIGDWDVEAHFPESKRTGGMYGFWDTQIERVAP